MALVGIEDDPLTRIANLTGLAARAARRPGQSALINTTAALPRAAGAAPSAAPVKGIAGGLGADYGDARLDGSQNVAPLSSAASLAPAAPASLAASAAPAPADALAPSGISNGSLASRPESALQPVGDVTALAPKQEYKHGGIIQGRGTGTSDSNTIRVSDGEAVLPADVVAAIGGQKAIDDMIAKHHKPVAGAPPRGYVNGGVVRRIDEEDPADWNRLAAMHPQQPSQRYAMPSQDPLEAIGAAGDALVDRTKQALLQAPRALAQGMAQGSAMMADQSGQGKQSLVRAIDNRQLAEMPASAPLAPQTTRLSDTMPNATAGQSQVRAVDNSLARAALAPSFGVAPAAPALLDGNSGWAVRDKIRGGAAPSTLDQGSGVTGARGNFVSQGAGGKPGEQFSYTLGNDKITATADKSGRFNSFSGVGQSAGLADYAQGLQRAASNREQLAAIEDGRNALQPPVLPLASFGQRGDERLGGGNDRAMRQGALAPGLAAAAYAQGGNNERPFVDVAKANADIANTRAATRATSQNIASAAGAQPYSLAQAALQPGLTQAQTAQANANAGRTNAMTPGDVEHQGIANKLAGLDLKGRQRVDAIGSQLSTETDSKKLTALHSQLLSLLGKDRPEEYQVIHAAGGIDPSDRTGQRKLGDNVVIANKRTGKYEVLPLGASKPVAVPPGMKQVGTSGGQPVYENEQGKRFIGSV